MQRRATRRLGLPSRGTKRAPATTIKPGAFVRVLRLAVRP